MGECDPDRLGAVTAGVLDRVGDQFGGDDLGVVRVLAQPARAERGPDALRATGTDSGIPGKASAISRGLTCAAVLAITWGPFVPA